MTYPPEPLPPHAPGSQPPPPPSAPHVPPGHPGGHTQELPVGSPYGAPPPPYGAYAPAQPHENQPYGGPPLAGDGPYGSPAPDAPYSPGPSSGPRAWHVVVAGVAALVVGLGIGLAAGGGEHAELTDLQAEVDRLESEIETRDDELTSVSGQLAESEQALAAAEAEAETAREEAAAAVAAAEESATEEVTDDGGDEAAAADGEYSAGSYTFADVQVSEDFVGDFEVRARMTNTGQARDSVAITATLFSGGSVVGTATGFASDVAADQTITLEMLSVDEYTDWDEVEFQVDLEF